MNIDLDDLKPTAGSTPSPAQNPSKLSDELGLAPSAQGSSLEDIYDQHMKLIYVLDVSSSMTEPLFNLVRPEQYDWPWNWRKLVDQRIENAKVRIAGEEEQEALDLDPDTDSEFDSDSGEEEDEEAVDPYSQIPVPHRIWREVPRNDPFWASIPSDMLLNSPGAEAQLKMRLIQDMNAWQELGLSARDKRVQHRSKIKVLQAESKKMIRERFAKWPQADISLIEFEVGSKIHASKSLPECEQLIDAMDAWGYGTNIVEAIKAAIQLCKKSPSPVNSHHIILVSDGEDYSSSEISHLIPDMKRLGIVFDFIHIAGMSHSMIASEGARKMKLACQQTGGDYTLVTRMNEFENKFLEASRRLCLPAPSGE